MKHLLIITLFAQILLAAPAFQGKRTFTQPDGTVITYQNRGDEYLHYAESDDGEVLLYSKKNARMEYAEIRDSSLRPSGKAYKRATSAKSSARVNRAELVKLHEERKARKMAKVHHKKKALKKSTSHKSEE